MVVGQSLHHGDDNDDVVIVVSCGVGHPHRLTLVSGRGLPIGAHVGVWALDRVGACPLMPVWRRRACGWVWAGACACSRSCDDNDGDIVVSVVWLLMHHHCQRAPLALSPLGYPIVRGQRATTQSLPCMGAHIGHPISYLGYTNPRSQLLCPPHPRHTCPAHPKSMVT